MKANFKKLQKVLRDQEATLRYFNSEIGKSVTDSKRLSEQDKGNYLGLNFELFDLMERVQKMRQSIENRVINKKQ